MRGKHSCVIIIMLVPAAHKSSLLTPGNILISIYVQGLICQVATLNLVTSLFVFFLFQKPRGLTQVQKNVKRQVQLHEMSKDQTNQNKSNSSLAKTMLYKVIPTFESACQWSSKAGGTKQRKAIEHYFHVVLFVMLYKVVLTFNSVDETQVCDHSDESYWAVLSCCTDYCAIQSGFNLWNKSSSVTIQMKSTEQYFPVSLCSKQNQVVTVV